MATSQNGWRVHTSSSTVVPFKWVTGRVDKRTAVVFDYLCEQFNKRVEPINVAHSWGYAYRSIRGQTSGFSNHASGTALDLNAPAHPLGKEGTFKAAQFREIRKILAELDGCVRWGGDYSGRKDEMHFEINCTPARLRALTKKLKSPEWSDRRTYQRREVNYGTLGVINAANKILSTPGFGKETSPLNVVQGSYNGGGVTASAGTHDGGGAFDTTPYNIQNRIKVFRLLGVAYWRRTAIPGLWNEHGHGIVDGDGTASDGAKRQVVSYRSRRDGLKGNSPDTQYRMLVFPRFVFQDSAMGKPGHMWLKRDANAYEQQVTRSKVIRSFKKGQRVNVVAVTSVGDKDKKYWAVTKNGHCIPMEHLSRTKVAKDVVVTPTPTPQPPKGKKVRVTFDHASFQFSDPLAQRQADAKTTLDAAKTDGVSNVTGTEAFEATTIAAIRENAKLTGFKVHRPKGQDSWICTNSSFVVPNTYKVHWIKLLDGKKKAYSNKGVVAVSYKHKQIGLVCVIACHFVTHGDPTQKDPAKRVRIPENEILAKGITEFADEMVRTGHKVFYGGDQNIDDAKGDTFMGYGRMISCWDELMKAGLIKEYPPTLARTIDVFAQSKDNKGTRCVGAYVDKGRKIVRFADHKHIRAVYESDAA